MKTIVEGLAAMGWTLARRGFLSGLHKAALARQLRNSVQWTCAALVFELISMLCSDGSTSASYGTQCRARHKDPCFGALGYFFTCPLSHLRPNAGWAAMMEIAIKTKRSGCEC